MPRVSRPIERAAASSCDCQSRDIVVAAVAEMQKTSGRGQKIESRFGVAPGALENAAALPRPLLGLLQMEQQREPDREVIVAQPAGTLFQVGLEMKNGVAVLGVARACNLAQLLGDGGPFAQHQPRKRVLVKLLIQGKMSGQKSAIQRGQRKFQVVGVEAARLLQGARGRAGPQPDIPHALNHQRIGSFACSSVFSSAETNSTSISE